MTTWSKLSHVVVNGQDHASSGPSDDGDLEDFLLGMANMGAINGPEVLELIDFSGKKRLLDVGSGPGAYAVQFCGHYPDLNATLFDRTQTGPYVKKMVSRYGLEDRVTFIAGDFNTDPIGKNYDVIWGSHILHSNSYASVEDLIKKFFNALAPGGVLLIQEFILDDDKCSPAFPALFSLNMLLHTTDGRSYSQEEIEEMMRSAGFVHLVRLEPPGPASIISAQKPT